MTRPVPPTMSTTDASPLMTRMPAFSSRHPDRQAEKWRVRSDNVAYSLPTWRTRKRTDLLIRVFLGSPTFGPVPAAPPQSRTMEAPTSRSNDAHPGT